MALRVIGLVVLGLGVAGAAGYGLGATREAPATAPVAPRREVVQAQGTSALELRRAIREELDARAPQAVAAAAPAIAPVASPDADAAFDAGKRQVDRALASHRWTRADAEALGPSLAAMTTAQRKVVLATLMPALNRGQIQPAFHGPVL